VGSKYIPPLNLKSLTWIEHVDRSTTRVDGVRATHSTEAQQSNQASPGEGMRCLMKPAGHPLCLLCRFLLGSSGLNSIILLSRQPDR